MFDYVEMAAVTVSFAEFMAVQAQILQDEAQEAGFESLDSWAERRPEAFSLTCSEIRKTYFVLDNII